MKQRSITLSQTLGQASKALTSKILPSKALNCSWRLALIALLITSFCLEAVVFPPPAQAQLSGYGFAPRGYKDGVNYGNGIYFAPYVFSLYTEPNERSPLIGEFHWSRKTNSNNITVNTADAERHSIAADHVFFCFYPQLDVAMMAVAGENGEGWVEVVYDQARKKTGWVHLKDSPLKDSSPVSQSQASLSKQTLAPVDTGEPIHFGVYQTWLEFMKLNAKSNGIYWMSGVKEYNRAIKSSDADDAKIIPVTIIRDMKVKHLRGNWLLVEVLDFENNTPIGWIRWRDDDGNLMVFPNINKQYRPVVMGTF